MPSSVKSKFQIQQPFKQFHFDKSKTSYIIRVAYTYTVNDLATAIPKAGCCNASRLTFNRSGGHTAYNVALEDKSQQYRRESRKNPTRHHSVYIYGVATNELGNCHRDGFRRQRGWMRKRWGT